MNIEEKEVAFKEPVKQAKEGLWLETAKGIREAYKVLGLYLIFLLFKKSSTVYILGTIGGITVLVFIYSWLKYRSVRFYIDYKNGEFIFSEGVFTKKKITIQLEKIQQVNLTQHVLQRLLKVYTMEISTAGSEKTEVVIRAIRPDDAVELKKKLLSVSSVETEDAGTEVVTETALSEKSNDIRLSNATIFKIAITSRYGRSLALILAFWAAIYNAYRDVFRIEESGEDLAEMVLINYILTSTVLTILALVIFWILFNIVTGFLRFYDYRIRIKKDTIQVAYGSLKTNQVIVYPRKVQTIEIVSNFIQRRMKLTRLILKQASSDFHRDQKASVEVPGCSPEQEREIVNKIFNKETGEFITLLPNYRKLLRPIYLLVLIPLAIIFLFQIPIPGTEILIPAWVLVVSLFSYFHFKNSKLMISDNFVVIQSGAWDISRDIMEPYKIQGIRVSQRLWHKRPDICHITLFTAAENLTFRYVKKEEVNRYLNKWLYEAEASEKSWM